MSATGIGLVLVCVCAFIEGFAQVTLKLSVAVPARKYSWMALSIGLFGISALVYSSALDFLDVGVAFAVDALSLVTIALTSLWFLREKITRIRWIGIGFIMIGVALVAAHA